MKKYFSGLVVFLLGIGFSAFFKPEKTPFLSAKFKYVPPFFFSFSASSVANIDNWTYTSSQSCTSSNVKPCTFVVTDDKYVHADGFGGYILNNQSYIDGTPESGDLRATIAVVEGAISGIYIVTIGGSAPTSIINKIN